MSGPGEIEVEVEAHIPEGASAEEQERPIQAARDMQIDGDIDRMLDALT